ncbi:hypothetical protein, partial [Flavobacterium sp.]|uniref:HYR-like domain-containing protein n=1 Tax=Flavobacterium sp. TaxID=239 RepID=UPI0037BF6755
MKNTHSKSNKNSIYIIIILVALLVNLFEINAQVRVPFSQRTSIFSPGKTIYNIKGDFTMIGNSNLTLVNYGNETSNNNNMRYVDVDTDNATWNSSSANLELSTENGSNPACSNIIYAGLYWTGRTSDATTSPNIFTVTKEIGGNTVTKTFDKRKVSIKGPNSANYTVLTAQDDDIYYPVNGDGFMYSGYIEVTDYVRSNGVGAYNVGDIALVEGNGGGTGYYGGWGMVIVYENDKMNWRDVTVFDGHSYVAGNVTADFEIPVSGFNTVQDGPVNIKLGMMAGEGDRVISGDYFQIRNHLDTSWVTLNHGENSTNNFFNSSIFTGGNTRNPNLLNNTGLDISMFDIPNTGNSVITNNQTSTRFRYGTTQDMYVIFNITMSVDAYISEVESLLTVQTIAGNPVTPGGPYTAQPGQEIEFGVDIKNLGGEAVNNYRIVIPIPYTSTFVQGSLSSSVLFTPNPTPNNLFFDPNLGATGSVVWDFGTLPLPADPQTLLASLRFKLRATDNCAILSNPNCVNNILVNGLTYGISAITSIPFIDRPLILGYNNSGECQGEPIFQPLTVNINAESFVSQNCQGVPLVQIFNYCNGETSVTAAELASAFPPGSLFYSTYPVPAGATPITNFPITSGSTTTYFAVPFNAEGCFFEFIISSCLIIDAVDDNAGPINGASGQNGVVNVFTNDTLNGNPVNPADVALTLVTPDPTGALTLNPDGSVDVAVGTPSGTYTLTYQICENVNPTNCDSAIVTITLTAPIINAVDDTLISIECTQNGIIGNALENDTIGTAQASSATVTFTITSGTNTNISFDSLGNISVTAGIAAGQYVFGYTICDIIYPANCSSATITITIVDTTTPTIADLPEESTINCPATPNFAQAISTDSCGTSNLTFVDERTDGDCAGSYSITRTWTATDASGNTTSDWQTINVIDNSAPIIAALPVISTISCPAVPQFAQATATDECDSDFTLTFEDIRTDGDCAGSYSITRTWTATDTCGNSSTASQTINVIDNIAPVISDLPADSTISCNSGIINRATINFAQASATDQCDSDFTLTFEDVRTDGECTGSYSITRTWTATDTCGNSSSASQTINVEDTDAPIIAALPVISTISCPAVPQFAQATATDECDSDFTLTFEDVRTDGDCAGSYSITRTWTATDICGNSSTASQTINVIDNIAPVISDLPADSTISCNSGIINRATINFAQATATDECDSDFTLTFEDVRTDGECTGSYSITRTWTATDACGNSSSASQTINVEDTDAPIIAALPVISTISCPAVPQFDQATATDECNSDFTLTFEDVRTDGECTGSYSITRTWTATDTCGNSSSASQTINVEDTDAPIIAALPVISTISCPAVPQFVQATATDECDSDFTLTFEDVRTDGDCVGSYSITRIWTATDTCGNSSSASQTINVEDNTPPLLSGQGNNLTIDCPSAPTFTAPTISDNCDNAPEINFTDVTVPGACAGTSIVTRTWIATDTCGNISAPVSQAITVQDITAPNTPEAPAALTLACASEVPAAVSLTATDNCAGEITATGVDTIAAGQCPNSFVITRTWTFTDPCNNSSAVSQIITVNDTIAPTFVEAIPTDSTVQCDAVPTAVTLTATDNCGTAAVTFAESITQGTCPGAYTITRTWTATDPCNNVTTHVQTITVQDTTVP